MKEFMLAKQEVKDEIDDLEGNDIRDRMLNERRQWIQEEK